MSDKELVKEWEEEYYRVSRLQRGRIEWLELDIARLKAAPEVVYEFAGWLSENGEDLHELPNEAIIAIVDRFFRERCNG